MGTDVHAVWQAKKDGKWIEIESTWDQERHYFLFSWLAGVRNGYGFAGVPTYSPVKPISEPRGYPPDFEIDNDEHHVASIEAINPRRRQWLEEDEKGNHTVWLGDHNHSWLTADEMLTASVPKVWKTGIVPVEFLKDWDGITPPEIYSGDFWGGKTKIANTPAEVDPESTHVRISWIQSDDILKYFTDEVKRLKDLHGEVRLVFGFDS